MRQSESIAELATALCAAQAEMGGAVKDSANPFFKSKYADLGSVVKAIKEPFTKHGLSYVQLPFANEQGIGVTTRLMHTSGEWLEDSFPLPMVKADPQAAGSAITYARRYALQAMAGIPTADDDAESAMFRTAELYTPAQKETLNRLLAEGDAMGLRYFVKNVGQEVMDALFNSAPQGQKTRYKQEVRDLYAKGNEQIKNAIKAIQEAIADGMGSRIEEIFGEMSDQERQFVMDGLTDIEKHQIEQIAEIAA